MVVCNPYLYLAPFPFLHHTDNHYFVLYNSVHVILVLILFHFLDSAHKW